MSSFLFIILLFSRAQPGCMTLNGDWKGDCLYDSSQYGQLEGEIEFQFQQEDCSRIKIDGQEMKIPGLFEHTSQTQNQIITTTINLSWLNHKRQVLNYDYKMLTVRKSQVVDDVVLKGYFVMKGSKLLMEQKGSVDSDTVQVRCELTRGF